MTWLRLGLGCTLLLGTALAHAQDDPRTTPDAATDLARGELAPPVAKSSIEVAYPRGATGDASVLLELLITKDGSVADARLLEGEEPFASRALEAARGWEFDPARRGGVSVAARIRARVDFRAPRAGPSPPKQPAPRAVHEPSPAAVSSGDPATADVADVTVRGRRHEVGQTTISRLEVREMPGAFGDGFRAIEALPGVTPTQSGVPYFFVRGAPPNNVGYYLDGVRLPTLFHLGLGGGVIHPGLIERIDFYPGAAPARFGGVAGGVVAAQTRLPALLPRGEVGLRLIDAGALLEVPFANSRGSALVAARYGYPGPIVSQFSDTRLAYWDYQARATWQLAPGHDVGVLLFGSHDRLGHLDDTGELIEDLARPSEAPAESKRSAPASSAVSSEASPPPTASSTAPPAVASAQPAPVPSAGNGSTLAAEEFRLAMAAYRGGQHAQAALLLGRFVDRFPRDARAQDAAYVRILALQAAGQRDAMRSACDAYLRAYPRGFRRAEVEKLAR